MIVRKNIVRFMELQNLCHAYFAVKKGKIRERGFMPDKKQEHKICGYRRHRKWRTKRQSRSRV